MIKLGPGEIPALSMLRRKIETERTDVIITTWYYVIGPDGAVQFMLMRGRTIDIDLPLDLGVHSPKPLYDTDYPMKDCKVLHGDCYYSGSTGLAQDLYQRFQRHQDPEFLWQELEDYYVRLFRLV